MFSMSNILQKRKELSVDKSVPWQRQKKQGAADLEYTGGEPKTLSIELIFDGFESVAPIQHAIDKIHALSDVDASALTPRARSAGPCRQAPFLQTPFRSRHK